MASNEARLEIEGLDGVWRAVKFYPDYESAQAVVDALTPHGITAMVCCKCGAYEYGACESCQSVSTEVSA